MRYLKHLYCTPNADALQALFVTSGKDAMLNSLLPVQHEHLHDIVFGIPAILIIQQQCRAIHCFAFTGQIDKFKNLRCLKEIQVPLTQSVDAILFNCNFNFTSYVIILLALLYNICGDLASFHLDMFCAIIVYHLMQEKMYDQKRIP